MKTPKKMQAARVKMGLTAFPKLMKEKGRNMAKVIETKKMRKMVKKNTK